MLDEGHNVTKVGPAAEVKAVQRLRQAMGDFNHRSVQIQLPVCS